MENKNEIYEQIGKQYRSKYPFYRIRRILIEFVVSLIIVLAVTAFLYVGISIVDYENELPKFFWTVALIFIVPLAIASLIRIVLKTIKQNKELKQDDNWLGKRYKYTNKNVRGSAIHKCLPMLIIFLVIAIHIFFVDFVLFFPSMIREPINESDVITVSGEIDTLEVQDIKSGALTFTFKGSDIRYHMVSTTYSLCDRSLENEVSQGIVVYSEVDKKDYENKYKTVDAYSFRTDDKVYLSFQKYKEDKIEFKNDCTKLFIGSTIIGSLLVVGFQVVGIYTIVRCTKEKIRA